MINDYYTNGAYINNKNIISTLLMKRKNIVEVVVGVYILQKINFR